MHDVVVPKALGGDFWSPPQLSGGIGLWVMDFLCRPAHQPSFPLPKQLPRKAWELEKPLKRFRREMAKRHPTEKERRHMSKRKNDIGEWEKCECTSACGLSSVTVAGWAGLTAYRGHGYRKLMQIDRSLQKPGESIKKLQKRT